MANRIHCSICNGIFCRESDGQLFCLSCLNQWLDGNDTIECSSCHKEDGRRFLFKMLKYRRRSFDSNFDDFDLSSGNYEICNIHQQVQVFYCCTCKTTVCQMCVTFTHERRQHVVKSIADICPQQREFTREMYAILKDRFQKAQDYIKNIEYCLKQVNACASSAVLAIDQHMVEVIQDIKEKAEALKRELKSQQMKKINALKEEKSQALLLATNMESTLTATAKSVNTYPDHVYVATHRDVNENMLKLCIEQQHQYKSLSGSIKFVPEQDFKARQFGQLLNRRTLQLMNHFGDFKKITVISSLPDGHLAVCDKITKDVIVYKTEGKGEYCKMYNLADINDNNQATRHFSKLSDLGLTSPGNLLLSNSASLVKFDLISGKYTDSIPLTRSTLGGLLRRTSLKRIAITPDNEIIVADTKRKRIHILTPSGKILRTLKVEITPRNNLTTNGRQIAFTNRPSGKLCIINFHTGEEVCTIDIPGVDGVCFDDASGSILISRNTLEETGVIEQYCSTTGTYIGPLINGIERPIALTLLQSDEIAVASKKGIKIFNIQ